MKTIFSAFLNDEDGAITVDFVVLTAAICTLGLIVVQTFSGGTTDLANDIEVAMDNVELP
jgi:Flp pilus assembly pilin Flp